MEEITTAYIQAFIKANELPLISTQSKLCIPIIKRICQKMLKGIKFDDIKICDDLIIDGHHRYFSSQIVGIPISSVQGTKTSATKPIEWISVAFDENDWDTAAKISHLNEQDAKYNGVDIEILRQITSSIK